MKNHTILIVEDNRDLAEAYSLIFQRELFEVQIAYDGDEALKKLEQYNPEVILLDIMMPYMNGFEFLKQLEGKKGGTKIIINSNLYQESEVKKGLQLGADLYLRKSDLTMQNLIEKVKEVMNP